MPTDHKAQDAPEKGSKKRSGIRPWWCLGWLALAAILQLVRADAAAALTVWPAWVLAAPAMLLALFSGRPRWLPWLGCGLFALGFVEEAWSGPRMLLPAGERNVRAISINCAGGMAAPVEEALARKPDIVFLQESPGRTEVERLAKAAFGPLAGWIWGPDASIIARGRLAEMKLPPGTRDFVAGVWTPGPGRTLTVVSLRLMPPVMRMDLANPECWTAFSENRRARREQAAAIARHIEDAGLRADLIAGDFNVPAERAVISRLVEGMADAFASSGRGWGATCVNPLPLIVRIDQVWHGPKLSAVSCWAAPSQHSDHRLVVADFRFSPSGAASGNPAAAR